MSRVYCLGYVRRGGIADMQRQWAFLGLLLWSVYKLVWQMRGTFLVRWSWQHSGRFSRAPRHSLSAAMWALWMTLGARRRAASRVEDGSSQSWRASDRASLWLCQSRISSMIVVILSKISAGQFYSNALKYALAYYDCSSWAENINV